MKKLYMSRYTHVYEKNGVYAYYHSLRMKPLYINEVMHQYIQKVFCEEEYSFEMLENRLSIEDLQQFKDVVNLMVEYKMLITEKKFDDKVINTIKNSLPEPYISVCYFIMTEFCNLACSYCFIENSMDENVRAKK